MVIQFYNRILNLFDVTVPSKKYLPPHDYNMLGFTPKEAELLGGVNSWRGKGTTYGTLAGFCLAYAWGHWFDRLKIDYSIFYKRPEMKFIFQIGVVAICAYYGDYLSTGRRWGALGYGPMEYTNNRWYLANKDAISNFKEVNRLFTKEQIARFQERRSTPTSRKWFELGIYYTEQQKEEIKQMRQRLDNNISPWDDPALMKQLVESHPEKTTIRPYRVAEHVSP